MSYRNLSLLCLGGRGSDQEPPETRPGLRRLPRFEVTNSLGDVLGVPPVVSPASVLDLIAADRHELRALEQSMHADSHNAATRGRNTLGELSGALAPIMV